MPANQFRYRRILELLDQYDVEFIVIGGVCAVAHGAPVTTFDLDVLHCQSEENIDRILTCLADMNAYHREPGARRLAPRRPALEGSGVSLFSTDYGSLDFLGELSGRNYEDLLPHSISVDLENHLTIQILDLETLIQVKQAAGRAKDIAVLPVLRETLAQQTILPAKTI